MSITRKQFLVWLAVMIVFIAGATIVGKTCTDCFADTGDIWRHVLHDGHY